MSEVTQAPQGRSPLLVIGAAAGGVLVLVLLVFFVVLPLLGGDDADEGFPAPAGQTATEGAAAEGGESTDEGTADVVSDLPVTFEVFLARDPFDPVVPDPAPEGAPAPDGTEPPGGDGGDGGTDGDGGDGGTVGGGDGGTTQPDDDACAAADGEAVCEGIVVTLRGFDPESGNAVIRVGGVDYVVGEGAVFAESFAVLSIDQPCATLLFGDESFTICEGERVLK